MKSYFIAPCAVIHSSLIHVNASGESLSSAEKWGGGVQEVKAGCGEKSARHKSQWPAYFDPSFRSPQGLRDI